jgi:NitT/TauT family transport system substrate-binding protein
LALAAFPVSREEKFLTLAAEPSTSLRRARRWGVLALALALCAALGACSRGAEAQTGPVDLSGGAPAEVLRLGYFGNVTHAVALVGVDKGLLARELGDTRLVTEVFNAGPAAIEALVAGAIDAAYVGPSPAINGYLRSGGTELRIVSGAMSGGAQLVVRAGIDSVEDLRGAELASPQLGNTQDVALRAWLADNGLRTSLSGGGDVSVTPTENSQTFQLFLDGRIDGVWAPEPWASRLVLEGGGHVMVDERDLWPGGRFATTQLIVATDYLSAHPQTVKALLRGNLATVDWVADNADEARTVVNAAIEEISGQPLSEPVLRRAFSTIEATTDPLAATLQTSFEHSVAANISDEASLDGIYDLRLLNQVLTDHGRPAASAAGLGEE